MWHDAKIPANWPLLLNEIKTKVHLWQGEEDITVSLAMRQYMAREIPNCRANYITGAGHFWIFEHLAEILGALVSDKKE